MLAPSPCALLTAHSAMKGSGGIISYAKAKRITVDLAATRAAITKPKDINTPPSLCV